MSASPFATVQPIEELPANEVQARVKAYDRRNVWFASQELDLTSAVIKELMIPVPDRNAPERAPKSDQAGKERRAETTALSEATHRPQRKIEG